MKPRAKRSRKPAIGKIHPAPTKDDSEFVADCARYAEGVLSEAQVKKRYRFSDNDWERLGHDDVLVEKIENERLRRIRSGQLKRERAQILVVAAPDVLSGILLDASANPRHRIDSAKELNAFAANGPDSAAAGAHFEITINLGADQDGKPVIEHYKKPLAPMKTIELDASDAEPHDTDPMIAAFASNKRGSGGDGNPL